MSDCIQCQMPLPASKRVDALYCSAKCGDLFRGRRTYHKPHQVEKNKARRAALRNNEIERLILYRARHRAKSLGVPFDLERSDIVIPARCPVLGMPLTFRHGKGRGFHPDSPSLDRIKPNLGYVKGNIRVISARANLLKNDASVRELELVLADLRKIEP